MRLSFAGLQALTIANDANLQPELLVSGIWTPARSLVQARSMACADPTTVRLTSDPRVLLENILKRSINPGDDLLGIVQAALAAGLYTHSLPLIQALLT